VAGDRATIEAAITELEGLVGVVVLVVSPPEAAVTVDGRTVTADDAPPACG
jgi:copper chaperone CopZ